MAEETRAGPRRAPAGAALGLGLSLALLLRLWGIGHGYPDCVAADERPVILDAVRFAADHTLEPHHLNYPDLFSYLFTLALYLAHATGGLLDVGGAGVSIRFAHFFEPARVALAGRLLSAAAGVATVALTWRLGRRAYGEAVGLGGALFAAVSAALVAQARYALPDVTMACLATAACGSMVEVAQRGRPRDSLLGGLLTGLAISTKYNAGMLLGGLATAHLLAARREGPGWKAGAPALAGAAVAVGFALGSPYWLVMPGDYLQALAQVYSNLQFSLRVTEWPRLALLAGFVRAETVWGVVAVAGILYAAWRRTAPDWILLAIVVPAFAYVGAWPKGGMHYVLFAFPLAGLLAARLVTEGLGHRARAWALPLLAAACLPQVWVAARDGQALRRQDIRTEAARWIEANIPSGTTVGIYRLDYTPPLKGDVHRDLLRQLIAAGQASPAATARLREMERRMPVYTQLTLEYFMDEPVVPAAYRATVDAADPKTREIFRRTWMEYGDLKRWQVRYAVLPSAGYERFLTGEPPPAGTAARYYYDRSRTYVEALLAPGSGQYRTVRQFGTAGRGGTIAIVEVL